jgi:ATP-dependent exoDNAse (exonuclease V) beta subunit
MRALSPTLTAEQERAVARRAEPLLVAAGAGSGKTSVLVERFVRAVREDGVAPARVLAITFTDRAAGELRARVRERLLALGEREAARDAQGAFVSTFHGFCARLLRGHPLLAGLDPDFEILDEGLAALVRERAFREALRSFLVGERSEAVDLLAAYGAGRVRSMVEGAYAELRSRGRREPTLAAAALRRRTGPAGGEHLTGAPAARRNGAESLEADGVRECALLGELLEGFGSSYERLKRARGAADFDDLELRVGELLREREDVRAGWSQRFELLMVDEFQDTNARQLGILSALDRANLFTVGDELQSIYAFRHADVNLFRARRAELAERGASLQLTGNFRSPAAVLEVVNALFASRFGPAYTPLVSVAPGSDGDGARSAASEDADSTDGGDGVASPVELLLTSRRGWEAGHAPPGGGSDAPSWRVAEARMLAERVAELVRRGQVRAGEVAVLLRAVGDLAVYERALQERGLPTLAAVGGFWSHQQVGDLVAYLRALANPLDEPALFGTLGSPLVGCSGEGLELLARAAGASPDGLWATLSRVGASVLGEGEWGHGEGERSEDPLVHLSRDDRELLVRFRERFEAERRAAPTRTIGRLIERALDASGYREHVLELDWGERRLANVHKLLRLAGRFEASEGRDLRGFLDYVAHHQSATGGEPDAPVAGGEPEAVRLMSIHAAKGLEFPVVCVADLGRAQNMSVPDLLLDESGERIGLRLARLDRPEVAPCLDFEELCEERRRAQAEEEDRILYVAMTRARERLLLSAAVDFERWPEPRLGAPAISWLGPALAEELPAIVQDGGSAPFELTVGARGQARVRCRLNVPGKDVRDAGAADPESVWAPEGELGTRGSAPALLPEPPARRGQGHENGRAERVTAGRLRAPARPEQAHRNAPAEDATGEQLETLSYTALAELERCGYRYYLERVLGLQENRAATPARFRESANGAGARFPEAGLDARMRGALVHRLLESLEYAGAPAPSQEAVARMARELGVRVRRREREEIAQLVGVASTAASATGGSPASLVARVAAADGMRRELPFAFSLGRGEPLLVGVVDLLARERDGGVMVLDYKSDRVGAEVDLDALVEREYGAQRLVYALAALRDGARKVEVVHWFLERPRDWVSARFRETDQEALEQRLTVRIRRARARGFSVSANPRRELCETCPGRGGLCSYTDAETLREAPKASVRALGDRPPRSAQL